MTVINHRKNFKPGWYRESYRHSLAAKGVKTKKYMIPKFEDRRYTKRCQCGNVYDADRYSPPECPECLRKARGFKTRKFQESKNFLPDWSDAPDAQLRTRLLELYRLSDHLKGVDRPISGDFLEKANENIKLFEDELKRRSDQKKRRFQRNEAKKYQYRVEETPQEMSLRENRGFKDIIKVDAKDFAQRFKRSQDEDLAWNEERLKSARERDVVDSYPQVHIYKNGKVDVTDGRHRLAVAAEKGLSVPVAVQYHD